MVYGEGEGRIKCLMSFSLGKWKIQEIEDVRVAQQGECS